MALAPPPGQRTTGPLFSRHGSDRVHWLGCEPAVFRRAQQEDKPVFMQLGRAYVSASDESHKAFRDPELAQLLNDHYLSVLLDVDEQPEWERLLSHALGALGARARRPSVGIFTPQGELFFAAGALPSHAPEGQPCLLRLLAQTRELKQTQPAEFLAQAEQLTQELLGRTWSAPGGATAAASLGSDLLRSTRLALARAFDESFFGFGQAPKLAHAPALEFLLDQASTHKNAEAERMALLSLAAMSSGGMYDQLWGGFFEATVDREFRHPNFVKRLGQNAELARLYLHAFQLSQHEPLRRVGSETLAFLTQHFKAPQGGFFFASHAETPQGEHYLWSRRQLKKALGEPAATHFAQFYGVGHQAEHPSHLQARKSLSHVARELGIAEAELISSLHASRSQLQELRLRRAGLLLDDRLITADNAAAISALALGALLLQQPEHLAAAEHAAQRFWAARTALGLLPRVLEQEQDGSLHDHVLFLRALIDLHQATLSRQYLNWAGLLVELIDTHFLRTTGPNTDELKCSFTSLAQEPSWPLARHPALGLDEDATFGHPAGLLSLQLRRLGVLTQSAALLDRASALVRAHSLALRRAPHTACALVRAVDQLLGPALLLHWSDDLPERWAMQQAAASQLFPRALFSTHHELAGAPQQAVVANPTSVSELKEHWAVYAKSVADLRRTQLSSHRTPGACTASGTRGVVDQVAMEHIVRFQDLSLCRLGLGSYRVGLDDEAHARALELALKQGVNVIDTSPSFALGDAQRLIGDVTRRLIATGDVHRQGLFFINKLGLAVGQDAELLEARRLSGAPPLATVALHTDAARAEDAVSFKHGAFSLDPDFLSAQIGASLERLGLVQLELCLLNSPEHLLAAGYDQARLKTALMGAFARLDQEVENGRIRGYGVMSNTLTTRGATDHNPRSALSLDDVMEWATEQNPKHRLCAVEMPANLVETSAYAAHDQAVFRQAKRHGLLTIACRPLSAIVDGALLRLVPPPAATDGARADQLGAAKYKVAALEAEFETTWAVQLRLSGRAGKAPVLPLSSGLATTLEALSTRQQFDHAEATLVTPRLRALLAQLDRAFVGQDGFLTFKGKYIQAVAGYLACLREVCSQKNRHMLEQLASHHLSTRAADTAQHERFLRQSWPERAVGVLLDVDCIDIVLLGMRSEQHVLGVQSLLSSKHKDQP